MEFKEYLQKQEIVEVLAENNIDPQKYNISMLIESGMWPHIKKGILAGALGATLLSPFAVHNPTPPEANSPRANFEVPFDDPDAVALREKKKDQNTYYSPPEMKKIIQMALDGNEWAVREVAWPKDHPLHKKGRPFFRNDPKEAQHLQ